MNLITLLAQSSLDAKIESAMSIIQRVSLLIAFVLIIYGGYLVADGRIKEGILVIVGAFIIAIAVPIAKALFAL